MLFAVKMCKLCGSKAHKNLKIGEATEIKGGNYKVPKERKVEYGVDAAEGRSKKQKSHLKKGLDGVSPSPPFLTEHVSPNVPENSVIFTSCVRSSADRFVFKTVSMLLRPY